MHLHVERDKISTTFTLSSTDSVRVLTPAPSLEAWVHSAITSAKIRVFLHLNLSRTDFTPLTYIHSVLGPLFLSLATKKERLAKAPIRSNPFYLPFIPVPYIILHHQWGSHTPESPFLAESKLVTHNFVSSDFEAGPNRTFKYHCLSLLILSIYSSPLLVCPFLSSSGSSFG